MRWRGLYLYDEIDENLLNNILPDICNRLELDFEEMKENILFMKKYKDDFLNIMDKNVLKEYMKEVN